MRLTVTDDGGNSVTDDIVISNIPTVAPNNAPTADAGADASAIIPRPDAGLIPSVQLDGTGSFDPDVSDTLTFAWTQVSGPVSTLTNVATNSVLSVPPPASEGTQVWRLRVTDSRGASDTCLLYTSDAADE